MRRAEWALLAAGAAGASAAALIRPAAARAAAGQDWSPFLLVAGLLLVGLVAQRDGVFDAAGDTLARRIGGDRSLFGASVLLIGVVSATLNLDTSVAFLTPVLVRTGRRRPALALPLLYGCILLSNAGSLLLPGSNLTNLIVLGTRHLSGARFLGRMALPWLATLVVTAAVVAVTTRVRRATHQVGSEPVRSVALSPGDGRPPVAGAAPAGRQSLGILAVAGAVGLILALGSPAPEVAALGVAAAAVRVAGRRLGLREVRAVLDLPVLLGLLGLAVAFGALGRSWDGPASALAHLDPWASAGLAAVASVSINNLPAASLLAARPLAHPFSVLIGLDVGPNLFVTGSLSWFLWARSARRSGVGGGLGRAVAAGALSAPVAMAAGLALLRALSGT